MSIIARTHSFHWECAHHGRLVGSIRWRERLSAIARAQAAEHLDVDGQREQSHMPVRKQGGDTHGMLRFHVSLFVVLGQCLSLSKAVQPTRPAAR